MWIIPIIYILKLDKLDLNKIEILELVEECLEEYEIKYIKRYENSIYFHEGSFIQLNKRRELIGSGTVKVKEFDDKFVIILRHSGIFLILVIFAILYILFFSKYSTFDNDDKEVFFFFFYIIFGIGYITRLYWHYKLMRKFKKKIKTNNT